MGNGRDRKPTERLIPKVERVIVNKRATVVFWEDGDKIVVRRRKGDKQNREIAVLYAIAEKALGSKTKRSAFIETVANGEGECPEPAPTRDGVAGCDGCEFFEFDEEFEKQLFEAVFGDFDYAKRIVFGRG